MRTLRAVDRTPTIIRLTWALFISSQVIAAPVRAAIFTVTSTADSGPGSLRQAIANANVSGGGTITFSGVSGTIVLTSGELAITAPGISIPGPGQATLAISGNRSSRVFAIESDVTADISGLTIRDGLPVGPGEDGGGIYNAGVLTVSDCTVIDNSAADGDGWNIDGGSGGGICNTGTLTMNDCTLQNNRAGSGGLDYSDSGSGGFGGGMYNAGDLTLNDCILLSNRSGDGGPGMTGGNGLAGDGGSGGGLCNTATARLTGCTISGNSCGTGGDPYYTYGPGGDGGSGGGIYSTATLILSRCTVSDNTAGNGTWGDYGDNSHPGGGCGGRGGGGGGICSRGTLALSDSTISGNSSGNGGSGGNANALPGDTGQRGGNGGCGGAGGSGGGIWSTAASLTNCTISGNSSGAGGTGGHGGVGGWSFEAGVAAGDGGNGGNGGDSGFGGGISSAGALTLNSCTVTENSCNNLGGTGGGEGLGGPYYDGGLPGSNGSPGSDGNAGSGGGIAIEASGSARPLNSLAANNTAAGNGPDVLGSFTSLGYNLIGNTAGSTGFGTSGDLLNVDPRLGPLADNGGPTLTCALLPGSAAIEAGTSSGAPGFDQRGVPRPQGLEVDIGAFEAPSSPFLVTNTNDSGLGSLRQAVADANSYGGGTITFSGVSGTIVLTSGELAITGSGINITGPGPTHLAISRRGFRIEPGATASISGMSVSNSISSDDCEYDDRYGGIYNRGNLTMSHCTIVSNVCFRKVVSPSAFGGAGICNTGTLVMTDCAIIGNHTENGDDETTPSLPGGGIYNIGTMSLNRCAITANYSSQGPSDSLDMSGGAGGGVYNAGNMSLTDCLVNANTCGPGGSSRYRFSDGGKGGSGGGIYNSGDLILSACALRDNSSGEGGRGYSPSPCYYVRFGTHGGDGGDGGGICNEGRLTLSECTLDDNRCGFGGGGGDGTGCDVGGIAREGGNGGAGGAGGGIRNSVSLVLTNCTLNGNAAGAGGGGGRGGTGPLGEPSADGGNGGDAGSGGGIHNTGTLILNSCTISGNASSAAAGVGGAGGLGPLPGSNGSPGAPGNGGGIWKGGTGSASLLNSIVANNTTLGSGPDVSGAITSLGHNLIGNTAGSTGMGASGDLLNVDPRLGPLADNGGPTLTCALLLGSPAIDAGTSFGAPGFDQRGVVRPQGSAVDIGAFEFFPRTHYVSPYGGHIPPFLTWTDAATNIQSAVNATAPGDAVLVTNGIFTGFRVDQALTISSVNGPEFTSITGYGISLRHPNAVAVIEGFTIHDCLPQDFNGMGGGVYASSDALIRNCIIANNEAWLEGGGVFGGTLASCILSNNQAGVPGTGSTAHGGACSQSRLFNCTVISNRVVAAKDADDVYAAGGGLYQCQALSCLLVGNYATAYLMGPGGGGHAPGIYADGGGACSSQLTNCTVVFNEVHAVRYLGDWVAQPSGSGGGVEGGTAVNCIIYDNTANASGNNTLSAQVSYTCTVPDPGGTGNITGDPRFVDASSGNFRLLAESPCIETGINLAPLFESRDLDGNARILGGVVDMGAYEFVPPAIGVMDDQATTLPNLAITIPVLTNDWALLGNQLAILSVSAPAHGRVTVHAGSSVAPMELTRLLEFTAIQVSNTIVQVNDTNRYPRGTAQSNGLWRTRSAFHWTSGFFPAELWSLYELTGDTYYSSWATAWMAGLVPYAYLTNDCDLGFKINCPFGAGYRLTSNPEYAAIVLQAAQSVSNRYSSIVGCIGDWNRPEAGSFEICIDFMMNTELLYHAAKLSGDSSFYTMAFKSAERTMWDLIRPDGSTYQIADYNDATGALLKKGTDTGVSAESTWARGQAWGIYGFTMAFRETRDTRYLNAAQRLADYYFAHVPTDLVPYWDFNAPGIPNEPKDSSAAAITLSALFEMSQLATNGLDRARYWHTARELFSSLTSSNYLAQGTESSGILLHGTGESPIDTDLEVDVSLIYGDYYFVEALKRYKNILSQTSVTYIPEPGFVGTDTFTYQACDSGGACSTATVTIVVEPATTNLLRVRISLAPDSHLPTISFPTSIGYEYRVEWQDDVSAALWNPLTATIAGTGSTVSITDTNRANHRFYRIGMQLE